LKIFLLTLLLISAIIFVGCLSVAAEIEPTHDYSELIAKNKNLRQILQDNRLDEERHPIDIEFGKAMDEPESWTTIGMTLTISVFSDKWRAEMEKYFGLLTEILNVDGVNSLYESQMAWETFADKNNELVRQAYDQIYHGGSIIQPHVALTYYESYRTRALYLKSLYDSLTRDGN